MIISPTAHMAGAAFCMFFQSLAPVKIFNFVGSTVLGGPAAWAAAYWTTDPLVSALWAVLAIALGLNLIAHISKNYGQLDKAWPFLPVMFMWHFLLHGWGSARLLVMTDLITLWAIGLFVVFWKRGAYGWPLWKGVEDHRWLFLQKHKWFRKRGVQYHLVWLVLHVYFTLHTLMQVFPGYVVYVASSNHGGSGLPKYHGKVLQYLAQGWNSSWKIFIAGMKNFNSSDWNAILFCVVFLAVRTVADVQQWQFQAAKKHKVDKGKKLTGNFAKGFLTTGLFKYCRHPNYTAELGIWAAFYLFSFAPFFGTCHHFFGGLANTWHMLLRTVGFSPAAMKATVGLLIHRTVFIIRPYFNWSILGLVSLIITFYVRNTQHLNWENQTWQRARYLFV
eukprot:GHVT01032713.1.p1 GENE.GHVT01032713.1~~GHVT01032713.1.p1  ORF type:complete len:390 (+),score=32.32 GHVT01032713.1:1182-2351(+)